MMWSYDNKLTFELVLHETSRGGRGVKNFFLQSPVTARFEPHSGQSGQLISLVSVRVGVVGNISACHADARGSIPRHGEFFSFPGRGPQVLLRMDITSIEYDTLPEWLRGSPAK